MPTIVTKKNKWVPHPSHLSCKKTGKQNLLWDVNRENNFQFKIGFILTYSSKIRIKKLQRGFH